MTPLDASLFRPLEGGPSFSLGNRIYRALWSVTWGGLASWTPPFMHPWRRFLLRLFGARIARGVHVYPSVRIWDPRNLDMDSHSCLGPRADCYSMARISLGAHAIVSQDARLCAGLHDVDDPEFQLVTKPIVIGDHAWVASGAFVGPGVSMGKGAVLGACAVAFKDLDEWSVYIGNPARSLRPRVRKGRDERSAAG
jgi:putative colanic acid biosynthesis acetyltransferase WcaF